MQSTLSTITAALSATSTASTITFPGGIIAGDLIVLLDVASTAGSPPSAVTPSGFTQIGSSITGTSTRQTLWLKLAAGTETGNLTGMNGTTNRKAMYVFRGNVAATAVNSGSVGGQMTAGNPTAQNVTASSGTPPLVVIGAYSVFGSSATVNPRTMSPAKDGEIEAGGAGADAWLAYKIYNSSPSDVSVDMDDEFSDNGLQSCYITMA
jgi:hypothetical protein